MYDSTCIDNVNCTPHLIRDWPEEAEHGGGAGHQVGLSGAEGIQLAAHAHQLARAASQQQRHGAHAQLLNVVGGDVGGAAAVSAVDEGVLAAKDAGQLTRLRDLAHQALHGCVAFQGFVKAFLNKLA
jgi:hypothetical protein